MSREQDPFDTGLRPEDLDPRRPRPFDTPWGSFALYTVDGRVIAASSFCPHMQGPLFQGTQSGVEIVCPWHTWRFSLVTGECLGAGKDDPGSVQELEFCPVKIGPRGTFVLDPPI